MSAISYKVCYNVLELIYMAKKMIKIVLKTRENERIFSCQALIQKNCIQYVEDGFKMKITFANDWVRMNRKNEDYEIYFQFGKENSSGLITLRTGQSFPLEITLEQLEVTGEKIFVSYLLNEEVYEYSIYY